MVFANTNEVSESLSAPRAAHLQARIKVRLKEVLFDENGDAAETTQIVDTTVGRVLLFDIVPDGLPFSYG